MAVSAVSASTAQQAAIGKAAGDAKTLGSDLNRFLTLLVTQLQNQDPLDPLDTNEFTAQLVQFAGVEQQIQNNANLETLIDIGRASEVAAIVNVIGKRIEAGGTMLALNAGKAEAAYTLSEAAAETKFTVTDASGQVVYSRRGQNRGRPPRLPLGRPRRGWPGTGRRRLHPDRDRHPPRRLGHRRRAADHRHGHRRGQGRRRLDPLPRRGRGADEPGPLHRRGGDQGRRLTGEEPMQQQPVGHRKWVVFRASWPCSSRPSMACVDPRNKSAGDASREGRDRASSPSRLRATPRHEPSGA